MHNNSKKRIFLAHTQKVLDFGLNGQRMQKAEIPKRHCVLCCYPSPDRPFSLNPIPHGLFFKKLLALSL